MTPTDTQQRVIGLVVKERNRQDYLWGIQNHDIATWVEILTEEVGEICKADLEYRFGGDPRKNILTEIVQVAAVAIAMAECELRRAHAKP